LRREAEARWKVVEACRKHDYTGALRPLALLSVAPQPEAHKWALSKEQSVKLAKEFFALFYNSKKMLAGVELVLTGYKKAWVVTELDSRYVHMEQRQVKIVDGEAREETARERIAYEALSGPQAYALAWAAWQKDGLPEADFNLKFGAFLIARAEYLGVAVEKLRAAGKHDAVAPMLAEAEILRGLRVEELIELLRAGVAQENRVKAMTAYNQLKRYYADEFEERGEEIREILGQ
jgi:hypothetical protein